MEKIIYSASKLVILTLEEVVLEAPLGHVLIHKQSMLLLAAIPNKLNQIRMAKLSKEDDLREPLLVPLRALRVPKLHGDLLRTEPRLGTFPDHALVHGAEPALAEEGAVHEPLRRGLELAHREHLQVRAY